MPLASGIMTAHLTWLDWLVILVYAAGMLAVGWHYSRRNVTADDYLLGGRTIKPVNLGLSLFATLMSTITYLALPGEVIKCGPMILGMIAAYPLVILIVGWLLIPLFMSLPATSAYEILETRLGLSVRLLASVMFLTLRLLWMSVIIYATSDKVLVPLMGLSSAATPWVCTAMGMITVAYTSMGGLRAVVLTDVIQALILFAGAVASLSLITCKLGGVGGWWPDRWLDHWPKPEFGWDLTARASFLGALVASFTWQVCTAGSDQMAIQRYLAARDARAARRVLTISLSANAVVQILLAGVGLALLGYFTTFPSAMGPNQTIVGNADALFPMFIARCLPQGISGLVVAGLLAAAMSSLSAGMNSSCSVIAADFINRFRTAADPQTVQLRRAKYISAIVGLAVVAMTFLVCLVRGNLLEVAFKVVNLLTAPLFGLFVMALFVPWSTSTGTFAGAAVGIGVVVAINYWEEITGRQGISFFWAMPLGLAAQVATGSLVSLLLRLPATGPGSPGGFSNTRRGSGDTVGRSRGTPSRSGPQDPASRGGPPQQRPEP